MDPNTTLEAVSDGAKAITKFQEILEKMFNPYWARKQNEVDTEANERKIKMIRDNQDMEIVFVNGQMNVRQRTPEEVERRAEQRLLAESFRQENNIENVLEIASADLCLENEFVKETVDEDWVARLFNIVKDVSNTEMQYLWGKILAGEIKKPGTFSLRTLETIRNLSQKEAEKFQKIISLGFQFRNYVFIPQNATLLKKYGVDYYDLLELDASGLISINPNTGLSVSSLEEPFKMCSKEFFVEFQSIEKKIDKFQYAVYALTSVGYELYTVLNSKSDYNFAVDLVNDILKTNMNIKMNVKLFEVLEFNSAESIIYNNIPIYTQNADGV